MPIYEYICEDCQTHFEKIVLNKQQEISCPKCAGKRNAIQLSVFSAGNGSANGASAKSSGVVAPVIKSFSHSVFGCHLTCHRALSRSIYSSSLDSWGRSC